MLIVTSSDCYISIVTFEPNELGTLLEGSVVLASSEKSMSQESSMNNAVGPTQQLTSPSANKPRRIRPTMVTDTTANTSPDAVTSNKPMVSPKAGTPSEKSTNKHTPRRVDFITLASYKKSNITQPDRTDSCVNPKMPET